MTADRTLRGDLASAAPVREGAPSHRRAGVRARLRRVGRMGRVALLVPVAAVFLLVPAAPAAAAPSPFDICSDPEAPQPEVAGTGLDALIRPPGPSPALSDPADATLYERYGMAGLRWHTTELGCADMLAKVGNQGANLVFDIAKAIDRTTITLYQAAYSETLLADIADQVGAVVRNLRDFLYLPYLTPLILLGVIWAAWHGLVRKRATLSVEGTIWMIIAVVCALWFFNRPTQLMEAGNAVVTSMSNASVAAVGHATVPSDATCVAPGGGPTSAIDRDETVRRAADTLWSTLACRPWLAGEFGTDAAAADLVEDNGYKLLSAQAFGVYEASRLPTDSDRLNSGPVQDKQDQWQQVRDDIKENHGAVYPLFQGKQWGTRLGIGLAALLAAVFAGVLILIVATALIVLKIAFLVLMMVGPLFLLAGIHPGIGRVIALRWFEMLLGTLLKQVVVAVVLALLLLGYSIVLAPDSPLPWGIQILLITLLALVAFIYRKPFQHLFASVGMTGAYTGDRTVTVTDRARVAGDGTPVTRRPVTPQEAGVATGRRRLGAAMAGTGTALASRRGRGSGGTATDAGAGSAGGEDAGARSAHDADDARGAGVSWRSAARIDGAAGTRPATRRPEAAPPLPFWLRPRRRDEEGGRR